MFAVDQFVIALRGHLSKPLLPFLPRFFRDRTNHQLIGLNFDLDLLAKPKLLQNQLGNANPSRVADLHNTRTQNSFHAIFTSVITLYYPHSQKSSSSTLTPMKVLGLMSGTSADGVDAALCEIAGSGAGARGAGARVELLAFECAPYSPDLRQRVLAAGDNRADVVEIARLNIAIAQAFADCANAIFAKHGRAELIGSHGQTVCHLPAEGVTLQLGDGCRIAELTGVPVVSDFRQRDLACGGGGAPLVPYADWVLLRHATSDRAILNIGGIANVTILPAGCELESVRAWDTGPGNMVIDALAQRFFGVPFDREGALAANGSASIGELDAVHPYLARRPPKSCGREEFGAHFADRFALGAQNGHEVLARATRLTARSVADSLRRFGGLRGHYELIVSGGGARNLTLMQMLRAELPNATVLLSDQLGVPGEAREAMAFALLAAESSHGVATNVRGATGARESRVLGKRS